MVEQAHTDNSEDQVVDKAVAEGGAYEVIRKRLTEQGTKLETAVSKLNSERLNEFGSSEMSVQSRVRFRTENNCIARDIVQVGPYLLLGYNVFIGLKKETRVEDVFALFTLEQEGDNVECKEVAAESTFLSHPSFVNDFDELYRYYKDTRLVQLSVTHDKLLAGFQIGERIDDIRVFRWSLSPDGKKVEYIDNRGERDIKLPPRYDFEWVETGREEIVNGRHPHVNIRDRVFVETINGNLTVKLENNTEDGLGIYQEPVDDPTQSLDDAQIAYAEVGDLILLRIRPYREETIRYFIFNPSTQSVLRVDALGQSCVQLPEDHGVIFPGGYYLQTGEYKAFDETVSGFRFKRVLRSPNGEDVLYVFYEPHDGVVGLFAYNLINKTLQNPILGHGYALAADGRLTIFTAEGEPTRTHPMQIWKTPYFSSEFASQVPAKNSFYGRIGNAELVRGISDLYSICRRIEQQSVSSRLYNELVQSAQKLFDNYYWLSQGETSDIAELIRQIASTSELVIDEFEKVQSIRQQTEQALKEAETEQKDLVQKIRSEHWEAIDAYVDALGQIRRHRGRLMTIRDYRYMDLARLDQLSKELDKEESELSERTVSFLSDEHAFDPYESKLTELEKEIEHAATSQGLKPLVESLDQVAQGLDLLSELMGTLDIEDPLVRTRIIDSISSVYSRVNQLKATTHHKEKSIGSTEAVAQFSAQFKLFSQSIANALSLSTTPEKCEEQLSRLLAQLEELESQYSEFDQFLNDIMDKREEVYESFEQHKQSLLDQRQKRVQTLMDSAKRMLSTIEKRANKMTDSDELNTYFASDALVLKIKDQLDQLRDLDQAIKADDIDARFKGIKEQALRSLRDKKDIFEAGGQVIKLGPRHRFSVNTQEMDLTLLQRDGAMAIHLTGTDFFETLHDEELDALKPYWDLNIESESDSVYRGEYLAYQILSLSEQQKEGLSMDRLHQALPDPTRLSALVSEFATPRYREGYQKGIHDHDATKILTQLLPVYQQADLLSYDPYSRGIAQLFWAYSQSGQTITKAEQTTAISWHDRARSAYQMAHLFASQEAVELLRQEVRTLLVRFNDQYQLNVSAITLKEAAAYLVAELGRDRLEFIGSELGTALVDEFKRAMTTEAWQQFEQALDKLKGRPCERWQIAQAWLLALTSQKGLSQFVRYIPEAVAMLVVEARLDRRFVSINIDFKVDGLLGDHRRLENQSLSVALDEFLMRLRAHTHETVVGFHTLQEVRQRIIADQKTRLRLEEFKARPLSSFVRNRLINESYLPIIGDNLAKQMGTVGDSKRSDLMGLLMMISPPGYGKTTLMEYVANRLGLVFMKINCPSLGHDVLSLDPEQAPNATARQELIKLNLGLEMGSNVMLYLDDIQHTHPEFLQKFISLCDGTRRIEGVWKGQTKTYDMRGRKFCVVMAGNPYTESGEVFKIPDMLANRADIYNLGDILGGMDEVFALSYIENALTSNQVLAPLATRDMNDVYRFVDMAKGKPVAATELSYAYSGAEVNEITDILKKMLMVQSVVLRVNQQYIASAAQDDQYRTEPAFKLQGSYRNMNKMTEKISAVMNDDEMQQMIADHYVGEAQLLTTGAEANLLKLAELRGALEGDDQTRWEKIKEDFQRIKAMGGQDADVGQRVVAQLVDMSTTMNKGLLPMAEMMDKRLRADLFTYDKVRSIHEQMQVWSRELSGKPVELPEGKPPEPPADPPEVE